MWEQVALVLEVPPFCALLRRLSITMVQKCLS